MIILILLAVFLVLGFIYAWIAGIVAKEEVEVKTGVLILFLAGLVTAGIQLAMQHEEPDARLAATAAAQLAAIALLTRITTGIPLLKSLLIAVIYTVVLSVVGMVLQGMAKG